MFMYDCEACVVRYFFFCTGFLNLVQLLGMTLNPPWLKKKFNVEPSCVSPSKTVRKKVGDFERPRTRVSSWPLTNHAAVLRVIGSSLPIQSSVETKKREILLKWIYIQGLDYSGPQCFMRNCPHFPSYYTQEFGIHFFPWVLLLLLSYWSGPCHFLYIWHSLSFSVLISVSFIKLRNHHAFDSDQCCPVDLTRIICFVLGLQEPACIKCFCHCLLYFIYHYSVSNFNHE